VPSDPRDATDGAGADAPADRDDATRRGPDAGDPDGSPGGVRPARDRGDDGDGPATGWTAAELETLALALGLALLLGAALVGPWYIDDDVYRYEAVPVPATGDELGAAAAGAPVTLGPAVACEVRSDARLCSFERHLRRSNAAVRGHTGPYAYEYVYLDGRFYAATSETRGDRPHLALEPVERAAVLSAVAVRRSDAGPVAREAVADGWVLTVDRVASGSRVVETERGFYSVVRTGTLDGRTCDRGSDRFCRDARRFRLARSAPTAAAAVTGTLLLALSRRYRARDRRG
jgi:hypothetical protein